MSPALALALAAALLAVAALAASPPPAALRAAARVAFGRPVTMADAARSMAYVVNGPTDNRSLCSATVIADSYILLAAHCKVALKDHVFVGAHRDPRTGKRVHGARHTVAKIMRHNRFTPREYGSLQDIMVLRIDPPTKNAAIRLNFNDMLPRAEAPVYAFGYGVNERNESPYVLRTARFVALSGNKCRAKLNASKLFLNAKGLNDHVHLCANGRVRGAGMCTGDAGGPLVMKTRQGFIQVGFAATRIDMGPCGNAAVPDIYTRVATYKYWILWTIGGERAPGFLRNS